MVKIARVAAFGGPEGLKLFEEAMPEPGAGEVRIRTKAIGLNRVESMYRLGWFGTPALPAKIGYEAAGVIEALGEGVTGFVLGDHVATLPGLDMEIYGTNGEAFCYPADMLVQNSEGQAFDEAAATWMAYLTAYAIVDAGKVSSGQYVLITAASSSVGIAAMQIARAAGAIPVATTRGPEKKAALQALGAAHVIVTNEEELGARCREITGGAGIDLAFDAVGGAGLSEIAMAMKTGGMMIIYGALGGDEIAVPAHLYMLGNLTLRGFSTNHLLADAAARAKAIDYIRTGLGKGDLTPVIDKRFPFESLADAHAYLESNQQLGKIVVTLD